MALEAVQTELENHSAPLTDAFDTAWNNRDADKLASLFCEDADFQFYNGLFLRNKAQIRKGYSRYIFPTLPVGMRHKTDLREIRALSENLAIGNARIYLTDGLENPEESQSRSDIFATIVVKKTDNQWLISAVRLMVPNEAL